MDIERHNLSGRGLALSTFLGLAIVCPDAQAQPTVTTAANSHVTADGDDAVSARGVCRSTSANPTTADSKTTDGTRTGVFTSNIAGLIGNSCTNEGHYE